MRILMRRPEGTDVTCVQNFTATLRKLRGMFSSYPICYSWKSELSSVHILAATLERSEVSLVRILSATPERN